ncbi:MAG: C40 family peptidase [Deltaproteobacteria bacterium]|nr:C40 family peptidase [Deltaproteobacteria bacterium]MBW2085333.1 C40 family peptidase [Deltaproteobacteria bacterium]
MPLTSGFTQKGISRYVILALSFGLTACLITACVSLPRATPARPDTRLGQKIAQRALQYVGTPYRYGGQSPNGFDCSGLIYYVYGQFGYRLPRKTKDMIKAGRWVSRRDLSPGDLVFFKTDWKGSLHSGIFLGQGRFVHAPKTGRTVEVQRLDRGYYKAKYYTARRIVLKH